MNKIKTAGFIGLIFLLLAAGIDIKLIKKGFFNQQVELLIPEKFEIMSEEMLELKYPMAQRPTLAYTNERGTINIALNHTIHDIDQTKIPEFHDVLKTSFKSLFPSAKWIDKGIKEINGRKIGYLELITPAIDTKIYNLIFFTDIDGKLLLCTFNCTKKFKKEWTPIAHEIMNSLVIKEQIDE